MAKKTGVPILIDIPQHGHSNADDGGVLKLSGGGVYKTIQQDLPVGVATAIIWEVKRYDLLNAIDLVTYPTYILTVPYGYIWANINCVFSVLCPVNTNECLLYIRQKRVAATILDTMFTIPPTTKIMSIGGIISTGTIPVQQGDYFILYSQNIGGVRSLLVNTRCNFVLYR